LRVGLVGVSLALAVSFAAARPARASTCGSPDILDTVPPDMAAAVPRNGALFAHYDASAEYANEDVVFTPPGGGDEAFAGNDPMPVVKWDGTQGLLSFTPPEPLAPGDYKIVWPSLRGLNTASPGLSATVHFTVVAADDLAPPDFAGLTGVAWDLERQTNDCTKSLENRFVFTLSLAPADDDGGRANLTLVVFQTSGSGVDGGSVPVLSTPMPEPNKSVTVKLSVGEATGHVCFAAIARDLTDKVSSSGSQTVCVDTTAPPFFRGCAVAAGPGSGAAVAAIAAVFLALAAGARRRAR
jgi:MYXO-CTERM domain-containing protein